MPRNLNRRIELMVPVEDPAGRSKLMSALDAFFRDNVKARRILPDGSYAQAQRQGRRRPFRSQEALYRQACQARQAAQHATRKAFEPLRPAGRTG
jgi:polyphosphate kinase